MKQQASVVTPRAGSMTAVMRAAAPLARRVLRVAFVQSGKVVEERFVQQRTHVTVGTNEACTFVLPSPAPSSLRLFESVGRGTCLNLVEGMTGRVSLGSGVTDLEALKAHGKPVRSGDSLLCRIEIGDGARGKIVFGDSAFLFQFVAEPPRPSKPRLPLSVLSSLASDVDWPTTIIAGFSFLLHFGLAGAIYADWFDPLAGDEVTVAQLVETMKQFSPPPVEQVETKNPSESGTTAHTTEVSKSAGRGGERSGATASKGERGAMTDARATAIAGELNSLNLQMIAVLSPTGHGAEDVLRGGDVPIGLLDGVTNNGAGVGHGGVAGLDMGGPGRGAVRPGTGGGDLRSIGDGHAAGEASAGAEVKVKPPPGRAEVGPPQTNGGTITDANAVVARMAAGFRRCYNNGLNQENPEMQGSIRITTRIAPNGDVQSAVPSGGGSLSGTVIACVVARVTSAHFSPPTGGGATLLIPVTLVK